MAVTALFDTSVVVGAAVLTVPDALTSGWAVSAVTVGELESGVLLAADTALRAERLRRLSTLVEEVGVLRVDRAVASRYAELRAVVGRRPSNDLWIAATALAHDLVLVTADERQAGLPLVRAELVS